MAETDCIRLEALDENAVEERKDRLDRLERCSLQKGFIRGFMNIEKIFRKTNTHHDVLAEFEKFLRVLAKQKLSLALAFLFVSGNSLSLSPMIPIRSSSSVRRNGAKVVKTVLARGAHKEIKFSNEGRAAMLAGVDVLADAVSVTLGPKGKALLTEPIFSKGRPCSPTPQVEMSSLSSPLAPPRSQRVCFSSFNWIFGSSETPADGVTVAKSIVLKNKFENLGARYVSGATSAFRV
jgi:hypothetical protein